jgi:hypothetical protein
MRTILDSEPLCLAAARPIYMAFACPYVGFSPAPSPTAFLPLFDWWFYSELIPFIYSHQ